MDTIKNLFPFLPKKKDANKFVIALLFYIGLATVGVYSVALTISLTMIFASLSPLATYALALYSYAGIVLSILSFIGVINFNKENSPEEKKDEEPKNEEPKAEE